MQLEELPECYQTDEPFDIKDTEEVFEGRGQRRRNVVSYNDGLDDDTWAMVRVIMYTILDSSNKSPCSGRRRWRGHSGTRGSCS
jgi:hypothetical protein